MGVIRIVLVRLLAGAGDEAAGIVAAAREVFPTIPGVVDFEAGVASDDWNVVLIVHFARIEDVEAYRVHPVHARFVEQELKPRMERMEARNFST